MCAVVTVETVHSTDACVGCMPTLTNPPLMKRMAEDMDSLINQQAAKRLKSSNMNSQSKTEPDPDAIKMFVGQIPRSMDENDLRKMFEEFGPVYQLNVLRDKVTGQSKGCCFVTFYTRKSALEAQNALHNIKTMTGMQHPIQMKPADSEKRNEERKLFIGMLSKKCTENDVRMMFAPFGQIEECTVLREQNGQSKGCAFVTYASRQCAQNAIKTMHHSQTMEGCRSPLVVKFADTQKDKEMKKLQQMNANLLSVANLAGLGTLGPHFLAPTVAPQAAGAGAGTNLAALSSLGNLGNLGNLGAGLAALVGLSSSSSASSPNSNSNITSNNTQQQPQQQSVQGDSGSLQALQNLQGLAALASLANNPGLSALGMQSQLAALNQLATAASPGGTPMPGLNTGSSGQTSSVYHQCVENMPCFLSSSTGSAATTNTTNSGGIGGLAGLQNNLPNVGAVAPSVPNNMNGIGNASMTGGQSSVDALSQAYSGMQQYAGTGIASFPSAFTTQTAAQLQQAAAASQAAGPEGANLFIYHLPQEFGDHDLMQMFMPFGTVISAKVFIDKQTNLSKCFGFVSYDNPVSAAAAIQAMNGFQIGMKRLKVQLKRPKSDSKPY